MAVISPAAVHRKNVDTQLPLDGRAAGAAPPMTERQLSDLLCFLQTLTDDYRPGTPPASAACVE
jgi:cytochrome c peroxidase